MTGKTNKDLSSVLPLDARSARIAAGGGLAVSLREAPAKETEARNGYRAAGSEPDELDSIAPTAAESRVASSPTMPRLSFQSTACLSSDPT
ncbi:MAG: hypothetical protein IKO02_04150 [Lentisphaeria bacterium]|nr:hypothetical protein [Lentisphaeria bacterium]